MSFAVPGLAADPVSLVLHTAINGLSYRQQVIADNIAAANGMHADLFSRAFADHALAAVHHVFRVI